MRKIVISFITALSVVVPAVAGSTATTPAKPAAPVTKPEAKDYVLRRIVMPVEGKFSHSDDFGDPRSGGRTHEGNDLMAPKGRPLLAAANGKVTRIQVDNGSNSGNMLTIRDDEGWKYHYIHINNDTPGTDDGKNPLEHAFAKGIQVGATVKAGQVVAYVGDSGNAEGTGPHLHFEIVPPDGTAINPYPSLRIAQFFGSTGNIKLAKPSVAMATVPDAGGYWFAASDGGIFAFGDAGFHGSTGNMKLAKPIVGMAATPTGKGYWLVATDGGIFAYGDAQFYGSTGSTKLNQPIVGVAGTDTGKGYWLVAKDGGIFTFGDAVYLGSLPATGLCEVPSATRIHPSATGRGYWIAAADGSVWAFGDAKDYGSPKSLGIGAKANVLDLVAPRPKEPVTPAPSPVPSPGPSPSPSPSPAPKPG